MEKLYCHQNITYFYYWVHHKNGNEATDVPFRKIMSVGTLQIRMQKDFDNQVQGLVRNKHEICR